MMPAGTKAPRPYAFIAGGSAARWMDAVGTCIADDPLVQELLCRPGVEVMSDLKARVKSSGTVAVRSMYWSVRCADQNVDGGLCARTLLAGRDGLHWIDLPHDPALPAMLPHLRKPGKPRVLRYVPLRRATLLDCPPDREPQIVKVKRPERSRDAALRLRLAGVAMQGDAGFPMPRLLSESDDDSFSQSLCPGRPISTCLPRDLLPLLAAVGRLHGRLHRAIPSGLPAASEEDPGALLRLASAMMPRLAPYLSDMAAILREVPAPSVQVLCHGDLGLGQILSGPHGLSLVDFDLCHAGEAAADIARFLVALPDDLPADTAPDKAEAAYLSGYAEIAPLPRPDIMRWHRLRATLERIHYLLRKDQANPARMDRLLSHMFCGVIA